MNIKAMIELLRPNQWLKNLMLFFPPFLGGTLLQPNVAWKGMVPFFCFCMVSSATYIVNDIVDLASDRNHPQKCARPLPSDRVSINIALLLLVIISAGGIALAYILSMPRFLFFLGLYFLISLVYSTLLKQYALVDIFCISAGFLLRLESGGAVFEIAVSEWLFLSVFLLSIFFSTGKRFSEKNYLGCGAIHHRKSLSAYPQGFLPGVMYLTGSAALVTYTMYVISRHSTLLIYSVPLCCFGLLRYILRIQTGLGGDPTESLLRDVPLFIVGAVWLVMVGWGIYGG